MCVRSAGRTAAEEGPCAPMWPMKYPLCPPDLWWPQHLSQYTGVHGHAPSSSPRGPLLAPLTRCQSVASVPKGPRGHVEDWGKFLMLAS